MNKAKILGLLILSFCCYALVMAEKDFEVTGIDLSATEWGEQIAKIGLTKLAPDYRYVIATSEVRFLDAVAAPSRSDKKIFIIEPADSTKSLKDNTVIIEVPYLVPLAYGNGQVKFELYNVVDTLDELLASQRFFAKMEKFKVDTAEAFKVLIDSGIQAPLFVDQSPSYDSYFNRIISLLFYRGKAAADIAKECGVTLEFVHTNAQHLIKNGYLRFANKIYTPVFSIVDKRRLNEILPEINNTIDLLYDNLKNNLSKYDATINEMVAEKLITNDPYDLLDGGSVLHHKYPTIFGLLLWHKLGVEFINDGQFFNPYANSDKYEAKMGEYMYLVEGGKQFKGNSFYYYMSDSRGERFYCGLLDKPLIDSATSFTFGDLPFSLKLVPKGTPLLYSYNSPKAEKLMAALSVGMTEPVNRLQMKLDNKFPIQEGNNKTLGARYWCWDYIVEELMARLERDKLIEREGSDTYIFQKTEY